MSSKNKFGFDSIDTPANPKPRERSVGPMGAAVRDAAESLQETTEVKIEQRRQNASDAKAYREAQEAGRVLSAVPLADVLTSDLPRDRLDLEGVAASIEMEELKASIKERGQKEPVELYRDAAGNLQLKKGWRRYTALSQLFAETGHSAFATVIARIDVGQGDRLTRYIDMVEENVVREDLSFAEMAQVAILAAQDAETDELDPDAMVPRLYASLHKVKRSYIRSFVFLLCALEDDLKWPKAVPRNLGVDVARVLKSVESAADLRAQLRTCGGADEQNAVLTKFLEAKPNVATSTPPVERKEKREFHVGDMKVTARKGECRIVADDDFAGLPKAQLEYAVQAFRRALRENDPKIKSL
ncbi:ParB family chromosome partitioning protein [Loktanella sp. PT4BL]|jgi:ParB family chromosome partitioning protein|uniref:ParB N-terminal domain-containing protein n=1 Tax=Loktanella sp. PT4BL TaxID=2135611 RepID=UPI000D7624F6|nr:ParB N-terminal domain-containing protein [Loktanella sp. PT4BL]PXW67300.1 ParB family chromosome partitioning protein [Loktanella sp. PT4BL]